MVRSVLADVAADPRPSEYRLLDRLRSALRQCASTDVLTTDVLSQTLRVSERGTRATFAEWKALLLSTGAKSFDDWEWQTLWQVFDQGSGTVAIDSFIRGVRGSLNAERQALVSAAFAATDGDGDGRISREDLKRQYRGKRPECFLRTLVGDGSEAAVITTAEWDDYHAGLSSTARTDYEFRCLMRRTWRIPGDMDAPGGAGGAGGAEREPTGPGVLVRHLDGSVGMHHLPRRSPPSHPISSLARGSWEPLARGSWEPLSLLEALRTQGVWDAHSIVEADPAPRPADTADADVNVEVCAPPHPGTWTPAQSLLLPPAPPLRPPAAELSLRPPADALVSVGAHNDPAKRGASDPTSGRTYDRDAERTDGVQHLPHEIGRSRDRKSVV